MFQLNAVKKKRGWIAITPYHNTMYTLPETNRSNSRKPQKNWSLEDGISFLLGFGLFLRGKLVTFREGIGIVFIYLHLLDFNGKSREKYITHASYGIEKILYTPFSR